jgi:hypothetical protein
MGNIEYIPKFLSYFIFFSRCARYADIKVVRAGCRPYYIAQSSSGGFGLQPGSNNTSIGAILGKLCDREDIGFAKRPACAGLGRFEQHRPVGLHRSIGRQDQSSDPATIVTNESRYDRSSDRLSTYLTLLTNFFGVLNTRCKRHESLDMLHNYAI